MGKINRFEEIESWKKGRELVKELFQVTGKGGFAKDLAFRDLLRRSATSVIVRIADGYEQGQWDPEFRKFLKVALGTTAEVRAQLYVALDNGYLSQEDFDKIYQLAVDTAKLLYGFLRYFDKRDREGGNGREGQGRE
jgi:four helix bundle protein